MRSVTATLRFLCDPRTWISDHRTPWTFGRHSAALVCCALVALLAAPVAQGATPFVDVASTGPLTHIYLGNELSCQVAHEGDTSLEFYPPETTPGDCGTFLATGGQLYAPEFTAHGAGVTATASLGTYTPFTPVSQSTVTGAGTSVSPYQVTTQVSLGSTPLKITEVDSYVVGNENYRTDVTVSNSSTSAVSALLYRGADCFLQNSDFGYGFVDSSTHAPACTLNPNNAPPGRIEELVPITGGIHYVETFFNTLWADIGGHGDLPDTCDCETNEDNSAGINWDISVPAEGSVKFSSLTVFSPLGALALSTAKTADSSTAAAGSSDGYTITISNPNMTNVELTDITDTLPAGFTYTAGSSSGATTSDPSISGQNLTWKGPVTVPASGTVTLHFKVTVAGTPGTYENNAGGDSTGFTVTPTGPTAPVTVTGGPRPTTLTTSLSGEGQSGGSITVKEGAAVTDNATLSGENASKAAGTVTYTVYSDSRCEKEVASAGTVNVSGGKVPPSEAEALAAGSYFWQASYSGDSASNNEASKSECGSEQLKVEKNQGVAGTCGNTHLGTTSDALLANLKRVNECDLPVNAAVSKLTMYLQPTSTSGEQVLKGVIYASKREKPAALLGVTEQLTFKSTEAAGWYELNFSSPVKLASGDYWIGVITGATGKVAAERYDRVKNAEDYNSNTYTSEPSDRFGRFKTDNEEMSLYATFAAD